MAVSIPGISTLKAKIGWVAGVASDTPWTGAAGSVTWLERANATTDINLEPAQIDASALEDDVTKTIAGRAETGNTYTVTVNLTDDTMAQWNAVFSSAATNKGVWLEEWTPFLTKGNWIYVQMPQKFPKPALDQNSLMTVQMQCTIVEYEGWNTAIEPTN